jgi:hypothetical protein
VYDRDRLTGRGNHRAWLDLIVHFGLHSCFIPRETSPSFQANS